MNELLLNKQVWWTKWKFKEVFPQTYQKCVIKDCLFKKCDQICKRVPTQISPPRDSHTNEPCLENYVDAAPSLLELHCIQQLWLDLLHLHTQWPTTDFISNSKTNKLTVYHYPKVNRSASTGVDFLVMSDVCKCSDGLEICKLPNDWLLLL